MAGVVAAADAFINPKQHTVPRTAPPTSSVLDTTKMALRIAIFMRAPTACLWLCVVHRSMPASKPGRRLPALAGLSLLKSYPEPQATIIYILGAYITI